MVPLEKAIAENGKINYCDECENFTIVGNWAYCGADGKLIHPIMIARGQGSGPARNCKKRERNMVRTIFINEEEYKDILGAIKRMRFVIDTSANRSEGASLGEISRQLDRVEQLLDVDGGKE